MKNNSTTLARKIIDYAKQNKKKTRHTHLGVCLYEMPKKRFYQVRCEIMFHTPNLLLDLYCLIETFCGNLENKHNKGSFLKNTRSFKKTKKKKKKRKNTRTYTKP